MDKLGIEPKAFRMQNGRSTTELHARCSTASVVIGIYAATENRNLFSGPLLFRCGIVVRTPGFHPGDPGSIPGSGIISNSKNFAVNVNDANGRILLGAVGSALGC
jgi:hypothetical protein